jgi:hypothetical protein
MFGAAMTKNEFESEYKKLEELYPTLYQNKIRKELIANTVKDLSHSWFRSLVKRIILNPQMRLDIDEAARSERITFIQREKTKETINSLDKLKEQISNKGYEESLKLFGAKSLSEAVKNFKRDKNGDEP